MDTRTAHRLRLTADLRSEGYSGHEIARLTRSGALVRLRRGAYSWVTGEVDAAERHRQLVLVTVPRLSSDVVVSHASAAVLHGLPVWTSHLRRVQVTRVLPGGGRRRGPVHLHTAALPPEDVVQLAGVRVTSLARTVVDLARSLPLEECVAAGDAALRAGLTGEALTSTLARSGRRPGMAAARRAVAFFDARSESPGESRSRAVMLVAAVPAPDLQFEVYDEVGVLVGRADFGWEAQRTLGEFDGKVKYLSLLKRGQTTADAVYAEKRREDALRDQGWQVVRWNWNDLGDPAALRVRLERAFRRGRYR